MKSQYTIMLPVNRKNLPLANECLAHMLSVCDLNIVVLDENGVDSDYIESERISFIHNQTDTRPSLVAIWNQCIKECPTEYPIIVAWRCRPQPVHFETMKRKIDEGFAFVCMQDLHFFTFSKHITTHIGMFDEGFKGGQYEDTDWLNRIFFENVAMYASHEVPEVSFPTCWPDPTLNKAYYEQKWTEDAPLLVLKHKEENIEDRNFFKGQFPGRAYLTFENSEMHSQNIKAYYQKFNLKGFYDAC